MSPDIEKKRHQKGAGVLEGEKKGGGAKKRKKTQSIFVSMFGSGTSSRELPEEEEKEEAVIRCYFSIFSVITRGFWMINEEADYSGIGTKKGY